MARISRSDYSMLMHALGEKVAAADNDREFQEAFHMMIRVSYDIQTPRGRVDRVDVTDYIVTKMGAEDWAYFQNLGVHKLEFVSIFLNGEKILETGSLVGKSGNIDHVAQQMGDIPGSVMRKFAKYTTIAMRDHGMDILKNLIEGNDERLEIEDGFAELIREFLDEELEETVNEFQHKLDTVFGVGDLLPAANWEPPQEGGEKNDLPPPE